MKRAEFSVMSVNKIVELLNKQKLVAGMVHGQDMPRHQLVDPSSTDNTR